MNVYQLKATLRHVRPPVWRRILVPADTKLPKLHRILQVVMGWHDSHMHAFRFKGEQYGLSGRDFPDMFKSERNVRLDQIAGPRARFVYEYDFGDSWEHDIVVEKILPAEQGKHYPLCVAGKRACPPEDCGGVLGYENLVEIMSNPDHEEYAEMSEWLGGVFDPEAFHLEVVNDELRSLR